MNKKDFLRVIVGAVAIMVIASVVFPVREYMRAKADDGIVTDIAEGNDSDLSDNSIEGAETGDSSGLGEDSGAGTETGLDDGAEPGSETGLDGGGEEATEPGGETGLDGGGEEATEPGGETGLDGGSEEGAEPGGETGLDDGEGTEPGGSVPTEPGTDNPVGPIGPKPTDVTPEAGPIEEFFDIAELKSIAREEYDRNYKQKLGSDFSGNIYPMLDYLVETVINGHLYSEGTELELIKKAREDNSYIIQLIGRAFEDEYKKALVIDGAPAEQKSTSPAGSDIVDYRPYRAEDERGSLFPGYIKNITKEVQAEKATVSNEVVDKFREYKVSLGFDISGPPAVSQISGADYVLLIDTSNSMVDNLENAKSAAKKFVDSVFPENYNYDDSNKAEIAVIEFSDSADVAARLTSDREELIDAIDGLRLNRNIDAGKSGTDMQGAILEAKDLLGIDDGGSSVSSSRNKNFIVFSDGVVTTRYTDLWSFDSSLFGQPEIDAEDSDSPNAGVKRWSNLTARDWQDGIVLEKISVAGEDFFAVEEEAGADSEYKKQVELSSLVTILEAQFAVNQGINIYSVDYSDSSEAESLMNGITEKLDDTPDFTTEINSEALGSKGSRSNGNKYYKAVKSADMIDEIISEGSKEIKNPFNGFKITEQLMDNFELVEGSVVISDEPFGEGEVIALGKKSVSKTGINLETTKDYSEGIYYLTYILKAKQGDNIFPNGADKTLYGSSALGKQPFESASGISFTQTDGEVKNADFDKPKISIQPNLKIDFTVVEDAILLGEKAVLNPVIINGAGFYQYEFKEDFSQKLISIKKEGNFKPEKAYGNEFDEMAFEYESDGKYTYIMEVTDLISNQKQSKQVMVDVIDPVLKVNVVDANGGKALNGVFETKISAVAADSTEQVFYVSGLGNRVFSYKNGSQALTRGTAVKASTYVPFGYKIVEVTDSDGDKDGVATINLIKGEDGELSGYAHEITIKVQKQSGTKYFFDWSWMFKGINGTMSDNQ